MAQPSSIRKLERLLELPNRGIDEAKGVGGILVRLLRQIWSDKNISYQWMSIKISEFIQNELRSNHATGNTKGRSQLSASAILRELERESMTIKRFILALRIMGYDSIDITVSLRKGGRVSHHSVTTDLKDPDIVNDQDDDERPKNEQSQSNRGAK